MAQQAKASRYEIHIGGLLSERLLSAFPELHARELGSETVLDGDLPDQAALHGVLSQVESLGLELLEVRRGPDSPHRLRRAARNPLTAGDPERSA